MWVKVVVLVLLALAVVALFSALGSMMKGESGDGRTVKALAFRVGLSALVFLFLILSMFMGWIAPHDVRPDQRYGQPIAGEQGASPASPAEGGEAPPR
ncbi:MAG: twin transmembrane helix small protein [Alcanivoracaceae bacterium]|jgi:energy-converting hydrogenase Eha subunit F|nr:twin transmembrane helix small protein [Alcanivoracaceae bacterium]